MNAALQLPQADPASFLPLAVQGAGVQTHAQLWRWLQGGVQAWLPHAVMVVGWGDFRSGDLHYDVVSSLRGLRTRAVAPDGMGALVGALRDCWVAAQQMPCAVDLGGLQPLLDRGASSVPGALLGTMRSAVIHGVVDARTGEERIFAALDTGPQAAPGAVQALRLLMPFIDTALRRMPDMPARLASCDRLAEPAGGLPLSERERQIMDWVAMGKTNPEIGCILQISEFTVKNHLKSIFGKLDVSNRAQAVARLNRIPIHA